MLKQKAVVITGSTSGIGLGMARAFAAQGANVMLNGLGDADEIEAVRAAIESEFKVKVRYSPADMSKPDEITEMISQAQRELGGVDVLVNNAGIQHVAPIEEFPPEKWNQIIAINLTAAFHTTRAAVPLMKAKNWGRIINIASAHGLIASPFKSAYIAAKHGIVGLTKTVALETAEQGITCNAICPGWVKTPLVEKQIDAQAKAHNLPPDDVIRKVILERQPTKKFVKIEEVAALAVFLASDAAASITGASMSIDGGWVAH
ncbi:MAG TPA: 3-hydroxybutyrate dehydrogenase [Burkholderiales bacterium]|nr:3-hydroxybutyrate dehydrogenase [Burkholderiales bacterium]